MEEIKCTGSCGMLSDNMMEKNKEQITDIIRKTRNLIENALYQNQLHNGNSFNDKLYFNLHKIIIGEAVTIMMLSGIYDSDMAEEESLREILGDFNTSGDEMLEECFECIARYLSTRGIL